MNGLQNNMKQSKISSFFKKYPFTVTGAAISLLAFAVIWRVFFSLELYADDLEYAAFLDDGFSSFWDKIKIHFQTFNGRTIVHLFVWIGLALGRGFCSFLMTAILFLLPLVFSKLCEETDRAKTMLYTVFFACGIMCISPVLLRETLFWTSGFFNYVLPMLFLLLSLLLQKGMREKRSFGYYIGSAIASFLLAASMEQIGISTVLATTIFGILMMKRKKAFSACHLIVPFFGALGVLSLFLSPATHARLEDETLNQAFPFSFPEIGSHFLSDTAFAITILFFLVMMIYVLSSKKPTRVYLFGIVCIAVMAFLRMFGTEDVAAFSAFFVIGLYLLSYGVLFMLEGRHIHALLLFSGVCSLVVIAFTDSYEPRAVFAAVLSMILVGADICKTIVLSFCMRKPKSRYARYLVCACLVFAAAFSGFSSVFFGYLKNETVRNQNQKAIASAEATGVLHYTMDYDLTYAHTMMFQDGYFYTKFCSLYDLEHTEILLESANHPAVFCGETQLTFPAITDGETVYLSLENVIFALGGSIAWTPQEMEIHYDGREWILRNDILEADRYTYDAKESIRHDYSCILMEKDLMALVFRLNITFDAEQYVYLIEKNS